MSGIAGIIHFDGRPVEPGQVEAMTASMAYRGPDGINRWRSGSAALGQCMLRTTLESVEENQPLTNEDCSLVLVMDGRVDNWVELRRKLLGKGSVPRSKADAELVLRAYETWGSACLDHIDGDYALMIFNSRRQEVFLARDRIGNKPVNYYWDGTTLIVSSEIRAIVELPLVKKEINKNVLAEYLAADWHSRAETLWNRVMRLEPGHFSMIKLNIFNVKKYWEPDLCEMRSFLKDEEHFECYLELVTDSIKRLSRSHKPISIEVSGGLDSSAIFCLASKLRQSNGLLSPSMEGYTINFENDSEADEI